MEHPRAHMQEKLRYTFSGIVFCRLIRAELHKVEFRRLFRWHIMFALVCLSKSI